MFGMGVRDLMCGIHLEMSVSMKAVSFAWGLSGFGLRRARMSTWVMGLWFRRVVRMREPFGVSVSWFLILLLRELKREYG